MSLKNVDFPILYAEDNEVLQDITLKILERQYTCIYSAFNGVQAWDLFLSNDIKLLIVDLVMPEMGGIELIRKVREVNQNVYIIVTSSYTETEDFLSSIHLNVNRYLIKPFDPMHLIAIINDEHIRQIKKAKIYPVKLSDVYTYDLDTKMLFKENVPFKLTKTENKILELLIKHAGTSVSYYQFENIWSDSAMTLYSLRTHLMQLKKKLGNDVMIENLSGQGYILHL